MKKNKDQSQVYSKAGVKLINANTMKCKTVQRKMISYSELEFKDKEQEAFFEHISSCQSCNHLYEELQLTYQLIEKKEVLPENPFLLTRIMQKIEERNSEKEAVIPVYQRILQPVLLSLLLLVGIFGGIQMGNSYEMVETESLSETQSTEYFFNDMQQEKMEIYLLNE